MSSREEAQRSLSRKKRRDYYTFTGQDARGDRQHIPKELGDGLDGQAWEFDGGAGGGGGG